MKEQFDYKFIDGDFAPQEAKTLLMSLINSKINFHNLNSFSDFVRFSGSAEKSKKRVAELNLLSDDILQLIEQAAAAGKELKIHSTLTIELI